MSDIPKSIFIDPEQLQAPKGPSTPWSPILVGTWYTERQTGNDIEYTGGLMHDAVTVVSASQCKIANSQTTVRFSRDKALVTCAECMKVMAVFGR